MHPEEREVELDTGERIGYVDLVVAPGLEPDLEATRGLTEAMSLRWSSTAHLNSSAESMWDAIDQTQHGRVVFTIPPEPAPCAGTALKPLFLACDHWRDRGVLPDIDVHLVTPYESVLDLPFVDQRLDAHLERFGVTVHHRARVTALDPGSRSATLSTEDGQHVLDELERAFVVPHYRAPSWVAPLAGEDTDGLIDVDPTTMAHRSVPSFWSLGDAAAVRTRPSGGALRRQVDVLAEFDRTGTPQPTVRWPDLTVPRRALWAFDRYLEPVIYYRALLKGRV